MNARGVEDSGQLPLTELATVEKAHDVRTLRVCFACKNLGNNDSMLDYADAQWHGRCFIERFDWGTFAALPTQQHDRMMMGDLGFALMRKLLDFRDAKKSSPSKGGRVRA